MRRPFINILIVASAVGIAAFLLFDVKHVSGRSMTPAVRPGETIIVFRWYYGMQMPFASHYLLHWQPVSSGDLLLLRHPVTGEELIKRCVASEGTMYRLSDSVLRIGSDTYRLAPEVKEALAGSGRIPAGMLFVVGDNAQLSRDSRDYGLVDIESVEGKVVHPRRYGDE